MEPVVLARTLWFNPAFPWRLREMLWWEPDLKYVPWYKTGTQLVWWQP